METGALKLSDNEEKRHGILSEFGFDALTIDSMWAFDSEERSSNMLVDYTLPSEVDKDRLGDSRDKIVQGFRWATKEGPLCEEPIRGVNFKIMGA